MYTSKVERVVRWLRNESKPMSTNVIGGNPAVNQAGQPVDAVVPVEAATSLALPNTTALGQEIPDWMLVPKDELASTQRMAEYVTPPRLKIISSMTDHELKQKFGETAVIVRPDDIAVTEPIDFRKGEKEGQPFVVIPLFFWTEYTEQNPYGVANLPFIKDRSTDPDSRLARLCRQTDMKKRSYPCPEDPSKNCRYAEVLNFIVHLADPGVFQSPLHMSFQVGTFSEGKEWSKLCQVPKNVVCYAQVFEARVMMKSNDKFTWATFKLNHKIAEDGTLMFLNRYYGEASKEAFTIFRDLANDLEMKHQQGLLRPEYEDNDATDRPNTIDVTSTTGKHVNM